MPELDEQLRSYFDELAERASRQVGEIEGASRTSEPPLHRWALFALSAAVVAVVAVIAFLVTGDGSEQSDLDVGPADTAPVDPRSEEPTAVRGEWEELLSTRSGGTELSPFVTMLDENRALVLSMENGGDIVAGEILDLSAGTAEPIATSPLQWRAFAMVGWTGEEVIVTGGSNGPGIDVSGAAYDPSADSWRRISDPPGFEPGVSDNQAIGPGVWTGTELISWQRGLAYDPANDSWREIAPSPLAARMDEAVTATDGGVLVWGGCDREAVPNCDDALEVPLSDGAVYDPESDAWAMLPDGPLDGGAGAMAVDTSWGGRVVVVVPHPVEPDASTVAALDPISLEWTELPPLPDGAGKRSSALTWTGTDVIVWGGYTESYMSVTDAGFMLDPVLRRWRTLEPGGGARRGHVMLWTQRGLLIAGGHPTSQPVLFTPQPG